MTIRLYDRFDGNVVLCGEYSGVVDYDVNNGELYFEDGDVLTIDTLNEFYIIQEVT